MSDLDPLTKFETETYPRIWRSAFDLGVKAKADGLPRKCNLKGAPYATPSGKSILKVYRSAWEQGWDTEPTLPPDREIIQLHCQRTRSTYGDVVGDVIWSVTGNCPGLDCAGKTKVEALGYALQRICECYKGLPGPFPDIREVVINDDEIAEYKYTAEGRAIL